MADPLPPDVRKRFEAEGVASVRHRFRSANYGRKWTAWADEWIAEQDEKLIAERHEADVALRRESNEVARATASATEHGNTVAQEMLEQTKRSADAAERSAQAAERSARAGERSAKASERSAGWSGISARWAITSVVVVVVLAALARWSS